MTPPFCGRISHVTISLISIQKTGSLSEAAADYRRTDPNTRIEGAELPTLETRYGSFAVPDQTTDLIGRFLARYGEWAWDEVCFVASVLPDGARVLDGGAFVGTFGLGLALRRRLGSLCLVEANHAVVPMLEQNVRRNAAAPARVFESLIAEGDTSPAPGYGDDGNLASTSFLQDASGSYEAMPPVNVTTLATLRAEYGPFDLIKLDVEGMELDILRSDAEYLSAGRTALWIECNEDPRSLAIGELLLSWGLELYYFAFPSHNPDNLRGDPVPIFPLAYEAGLLAAPRVAPSLDAESHRHLCILRPVRTMGDLKEALWRTPRWGMPEWRGASAEQVAALAGRTLRGETFESYLAPGWSPRRAPGEMLRHQFDGGGAPPTAESLAFERLAVEQERRTAVETAFRTAEQLAFDRLAQLESEQQHRAGIEEARLAAERLAAAYARQVAFEQRRHEQIETMLGRASAQALDRLAELGAERERRAEAEDRTKEAQSSLARLERDVADQRSRREALEQQVVNLESQAVMFERRADDLFACAEAADALADERLRELDTERARREHAERTLAEFRSWSQGRLWEIEGQRLRCTAERNALAVRVEALSAGMDALVVRAETAEALATALQTSTTWRFASRLCRFVAARPGLHALMRHIVRVIGFESPSRRSASVTGD